MHSNELSRRIEFDLKSPASAVTLNNPSNELHHSRPIRQDSRASHLSSIDNEGRISFDGEQCLSRLILGQLENEWNEVIENWSVYRKKKSTRIKVNELFTDTSFINGSPCFRN